jgi:hypothetical protein
MSRRSFFHWYSLGLLLLSLLSVTALQAQTVWRPFNSDSPWNVTIGDNPLVDKSSDVYVGQINTLYRKITGKTDECFISTTRSNWGIALFFIDNIQPYPKHLFVSCHTDWGFPAAAPLPAWAIPDQSEDAHLCIIDRKEGLEWDFWNVKGRYPQFTCGSSVLVNTFGAGAITSGHGCRESGFPLSAGLIRPEELAAGEIRHALVFGFDGRNGWDQFVYPAITGCDEAFGPAGSLIIPMGSRLQLKPDRDISRLTPAARVVARALQSYGMLLGDEGDGRSMSIYMQTIGEVNGDKTADTWNTLWNGLWTENDRQSLAQLRTSDFRVIELPVVGAGRPPHIVFVSPADTVSTDKSIIFELAQTAGANPITETRFYLDQPQRTQPSATDVTSPFIWRQQARQLASGRHTIYAVAIDQRGSKSWTSKTFYVKPQ